MEGSRAYYLCDFFFIFHSSLARFHADRPPEIYFGGYFLRFAHILPEKAEGS